MQNSTSNYEAAIARFSQAPSVADRGEAHEASIREIFVRLSALEHIVLGSVKESTMDLDASASQELFTSEPFTPVDFEPSALSSECPTPESHTPDDNAARVEELQREVERLQETVVSEGQKQRDALTEADCAREEKGELKAQVAALEIENQLLNNAKQLTHTAVENLKLAVEKLETRDANKDDTIKGLREEIAQLESALNEQAGRLANARSRSQELQEDLSAAFKRSHGLLDRVEAAEAQNEVLRLEHDALKESKEQHESRTKFRDDFNTAPLPLAQQGIATESSLADSLCASPSTLTLKTTRALDEQWVTAMYGWTSEKALENFESLLLAFPNVDYINNFAQVPWPTLQDLRGDDYTDWSDNLHPMAFFAFVKEVYSEQEYRSLVKRTHDVFLPQFWGPRRTIGGSVSVRGLWGNKEVHRAAAMVSAIMTDLCMELDISTSGSQTSSTANEG